MLKGINPLLSGAILKMLDELGHGDQLVIADRNFPSYTQGVPTLRVDSESIVEVFDAILTVFPLDLSVDVPLERIGPQNATAAGSPRGVGSGGRPRSGPRGRPRSR